MKLAPKLRFPGFTDAWQNSRLSDVADRGEYGMNAAAKPFDGISKYIRITDIDDNTHKLLTGNITSPSGRLDDKYLLRQHDIVFARTGASTGKSYIYREEDGELYFAGFLIRFHINEANPYFVYTQTLRKEYNRWVAAVSARSGQPGINAEEYASYKFYTPSRVEQDKIAGFLMAVDDRIEKSEKKVELLKKYKKSAMQKIFTQKNQFKDEKGNLYPDWENKALGHLFMEREERGDGSRLMLSVTIDKGVIPFTSIDRKDNSSSDKSKYKHVEPGDIAYNSMRMWQGASGLVPVSGMVSPAYTVLKARVGNVPTFWAYYFKLPRVVSTFQRFSQGLTSDTWNLKYKQLSEIKLDVPCTEEQQKIANFLSSLDGRIELENKKLHQAKQFKKFLLQRMFV